MARTTTSRTTTPDRPEKIVEIDVATEMEGSFLEYAYSVIYARALPDARDGLKPVQRRILFQMGEMGLRPDRPYVKSARVVGDVMGKLHPHGDSAIYDAMVRLAQPFSLRLPLVDGHGNFGSLDDGPAAPRYTEARMAPAAVALTADLGEDVVDFVPNYDNKLTQPVVLPAAFPNLLVNGATGIAVGMATNMAPHNLAEVIAGAQHLLTHPNATLDDLMAFIPGPDLPSGGRIVGLDGIRDAYTTGRGAFRTRATASVEQITPRKQGIVVTELPYGVGPEKVIEKIKEGVTTKRLTGITDVTDLTDRTNGLRLVIEVKTGFNPAAVLDQLYRTTPLEDSFSINNVALVDGEPRTLGLVDLLRVWVDHRVTVTRRRCQHRLAAKQDRLHLVEGMLKAILDIDKVIGLIRTSADADTAKTRLIRTFKLSDVQAEYILELRLRRLTKMSKVELDTERKALVADITTLQRLLADEKKLRALVSDEMGQVATDYGTPRRTVLLAKAEPSAVTTAAAAGDPAALEIPDTPCHVIVSTGGRIARTVDATPIPTTGRRIKHDPFLSTTTTTTRGHVGIVTSTGRVVRVPVLDIPALQPSTSRPSLTGGAAVTTFTPTGKGERIVGVVDLAPDALPIALGTAQGVVKRVTPGDQPTTTNEWTLIALKDGDQVIGVGHGTDNLVFVSSDASLLTFAAEDVRPQGRAAGGMAGIRLAPGARAVAFATPPAGDGPVVVTVAADKEDTPTTVKVSPLTAYPGKGRGTGGVRSHRFLAGETHLAVAWVGTAPRGTTTDGTPTDLPDVDPRRDGSGKPVTAPIATIG